MGIPTLISTSTASDSSSIDITSGIDSTYDEYMFVFTDIGPATDTAHFAFQANAVGESDFDEYITSTYFYAYHAEDDGENSLTYNTNSDQAQGTAYQHLADYIGNGADESAAGVLHFFSPSSTTYVKHFYSRFNMYNANAQTADRYAAGYINTTSAIDEISFKMSSGNFDGVIQMYGIS
jgi:hypothetical protein